MISMCGLAGGWGPAEGSVVSGVWAPAGTSVDSASGRPSDNPSATRSHVLIGFPPCLHPNRTRGGAPLLCATKPYYAHRRCRCTVNFDPALTSLVVTGGGALRATQAIGYDRRVERQVGGR